MAESDYVRFKREALAMTKARENEAHTHEFNNPRGYQDIWEIVKCSSCPSQIKWHPVYADTSIRS